MRKIKINGIYKHFKGDHYIVIGIAKNCETTEDYIVYRELYENGNLWIRSKDSFLSEVDHKKYPQIKQKYKFELQKIKSVKK